MAERVTKKSGAHSWSFATSEGADGAREENDKGGESGEAKQ